MSHICLLVFIISLPHVHGSTTVYSETFDDGLSTWNETPFVSNGKYVDTGLGKDDTGVGLRCALVPNENGSPSINKRISLTPSLQYTLTYNVYFEPGFDFVKGGKLPGLCGGPSDVLASACVQPQPINAWSYRLSFNVDGRLQMYIYDQSRLDVGAPTCGICSIAGSGCNETTGVCPQNWYSAPNNFRFTIGRWYELKAYVKLNSYAEAKDGIAKLYVDGKLLTQRTNVKFRGSNDTSTLINTMWFNTFYGGDDSSYAPSTTTYIRFDNFVVTQD